MLLWAQGLDRQGHGGHQHIHEFAVGVGADPPRVRRSLLFRLEHQLVAFPSLPCSGLEDDVRQRGELGSQTLLDPTLHLSLCGAVLGCGPHEVGRTG